MTARIELLRAPIEPAVLRGLVEEVFGDMVKFVVDVERRIAAVGGEMHVDAEAVLLEDGSRQENLWGGNLYPDAPESDRIEYASLINIRPAQDNFSMAIQSEALRDEIREIVERLLLPGSRNA